jgi:hypothetical protein
MGLMDDMKKQAKDTMQGDDMKAKIQKIADEKGISMEEAKKHIMKKKES